MFYLGDITELQIFYLQLLKVRSQKKNLLPNILYSDSGKVRSSANIKNIKLLYCTYSVTIFNRPSVAGAALQTS